jgi:hypothetical protein
MPIVYGAFALVGGSTPAALGIAVREGTTGFLAR